ELFLLERQNNTLINILTVPITKRLLIKIKTVALCIVALSYTVLTFFSICLLETKYNLHTIHINFVLTHLGIYAIHGTVCAVIAMMIIGIMLRFKQSAQTAVAVSFIASFIGIFISQTPLPYLYCVNAMFYLSGATQSTGVEKIIAALAVMTMCGLTWLLFNRLSKEEC
ncbi:MAG: ABC transporter permease, partial [Treponema sp.]